MKRLDDDISTKMDAEDYQEKLKTLDRLITELKAGLKSPDASDEDRNKCVHSTSLNMS
jgi:hypothetical protein